MRSFNDIYEEDPQQDQEEEALASASTEAYEAALDSLEEARSVRERQRDEMMKRYAALKGGDHGEE